MGTGTSTSTKKKRGTRGTYMSWNSGERKKAMDAAVEARLLGNDPIVAAQKIVPCIDIPRQTLGDRVKAETKRREAAANASGGKDDSLEVFDRNKTFGDTKLK